MGDSYDNALMESAIGRHKTELTDRHGPWRGRSRRAAALVYIYWFNHRRLLGTRGDLPPVEYEAASWAANPEPRTGSKDIAF